MLDPAVLPRLLGSAAGGCGGLCSACSPRRCHASELFSESAQLAHCAVAGPPGKGIHLSLSLSLPPSLSSTGTQFTLNCLINHNFIDSISSSWTSSLSLFFLIILACYFPHHSVPSLPSCFLPCSLPPCLPSLLPSFLPCFFPSLLSSFPPSFRRGGGGGGEGGKEGIRDSALGKDGRRPVLGKGCQTRDTLPYTQIHSTPNGISCAGLLVSTSRLVRVIVQGPC